MMIPQNRPMEIMDKNQYSILIQVCREGPVRYWKLFSKKPQQPSMSPFLFNLITQKGKLFDGQLWVTATGTKRLLSFSF